MSIRPLSGWVLAVVLLSGVMLLGVLVGSEPVSLSAALSEPGTARTILVTYRLPRVVRAAVAVGGLAGGGAALQALRRNPLAEP